jgi:hypothetical protein
MGEKLFEKDIINDFRGEISLMGLPMGIYIVRLFDGKNYYCKRLVIE